MWADTVTAISLSLCRDASLAIEWVGRGEGGGGATTVIRRPKVLGSNTQHFLRGDSEKYQELQSFSPSLSFLRLFLNSGCVQYDATSGSFFVK